MGKAADALMSHEIFTLFTFPSLANAVKTPVTIQAGARLDVPPVPIVYEPTLRRSE